MFYDGKTGAALFVGCVALMFLLGIGTAGYAVFHGTSLLAGVAIVGVFVVIGVFLWAFLLSAASM